MWVKQCHKPSPSHHHKYIGAMVTIPKWMVHDSVLPIWIVIVHQQPQQNLEETCSSPARHLSDQVNQGLYALHSLFWLMDYPWINCGLSLWWVKYILWLPELIAGAINWKISNNFPPKNHQTLFKNWEFHAKKNNQTHHRNMCFSDIHGYAKKIPLKTEAHHPNLHVDDSQHHLRPGGTLNGGESHNFMYWLNWINCYIVRIRITNYQLYHIIS